MLSFCLLGLAVRGTLATQPNPPAWPDSVAVFAPGDPSIATKVQAAFAQNGGHSPANNGQFSKKRFAFMFKPGSYTDDIPVGYYTSIYGLGAAPTDTVFDGDKGVFCEEGDYSIGGALSTFWRSAENFRTTAVHNWGVGKGMMWAVSQAAPIRAVQVDNDLALFEYQPPIPAAGEASGGFMANVKVGGTVATRGGAASHRHGNASALGGVSTGSQQQWFSRNCNVGNWMGGVWNMVFTGVVGAPPSHCSDTKPGPFTTVDKTPTVAEKPYVTIDSAGKFSLQVPAPKTDSAGTDFAESSKARTVPFESIYVTKVTDGATEINAQLAAGLSVIISPAIYKLDAPLNITTSGTVVLGLGFATLIPSAGTAVISVADGVDDVRIAGLLLQAGPVVGGFTTPALLAWGSAAGYAGKASAPGVISDVFGRVGGPDGDTTSPVAATAIFDIRSGNVIGDNMWLWRADHAAGEVTYDSNRNDHGMLVSGDDVTMYGLAVEHAEKDLTIWTGERGRTYFYQSELPYIVTQAEFGDPGYAGYRVADGVKAHNAWGVGVYCFFNKHQVIVNSGIVAPPALVPNFIAPLSVWLNGVAGSGIQHVINELGNPNMGPTTGPQYVC